MGCNKQLIYTIIKDNMNLTKDEILAKMRSEMPFNLSDEILPYIKEAMQIYADQNSPSPMEGKKARKHNSPKLQEILDEITLFEMEGKTPLKGWISVEERLPEENQLVWGWDGEKSVALCCLIYQQNEGWFWGIADYSPYIENGKIVADCIIEDIDVKYWQPLPELKLRDK